MHKSSLAVAMPPMSSPSQPLTSASAAQDAIRDEFGLQTRKVSTAQANATADAVQSAASLDLAWRVVFAAEQRKASLLDNARPLGFRARRSAEKHVAAHDPADRPTAAHGSRAILPSGGGGELQVSPVPMQPMLRTGKLAAQPVNLALQAPAFCDMQEREDFESLSREIRAGAALVPIAKEGASAPRRRDKQATPASTSGGIAVAGQAFARNRPLTSSSRFSSNEGSAQDDANVCAPALGSSASAHSPEDGADAQAVRDWQSQCASGPGCEPQAFKAEAARLAAQSDQAVGSTWADDIIANPQGKARNGRRVLISAENDHNEPSQAVALAGWSQVLKDSASFEGDQSAPASAGNACGSAPATRDSGASESTATKSASTASARAPRRVTNQSGSSKLTAPSPSVQEPLSPQRPGASVRRSRSMPAPRKSPEDSCGKPKSTRAPFARRTLAPSSHSMPKSTSAAAAGAGAVAAKKRAKASKKLMLPFAYAEDDPRVAMVECADGRIIPEFLP